MRVLGNTPRKTSSATRIAVAIIIVILVIVGVLAALTYPRAVLSFSVSFTAGAQVETKGFSVPILDGQVQVQVSVTSGTALWSARIQSDGNNLWSHAAAQGEQTSYSSGWMSLAMGNYNFTFATIGLGTLNADITVSSKGGFW